MTRLKTTESVRPAAAASEEPVNNIRVIREYVESLAIALVLAFFLKAFATEAFVIPTGSMATTLMGRHKDVDCEQCGFRFQISASEESNDASDRPRDSHLLSSVVGGTCPQCHYTMYVGKDNFHKKTFLSFNGDRIFVNKSQFDFRDPQRWHVTVFRYPGAAQINYIKRLIGVENETIRLQNGDVFAMPDGAAAFEMQRKPLRALLAMLRPVDDNDYVQPKLLEIGWPARWFDETEAWHRSEDGKSFHLDATGQKDFASLNYRQIVASSSDWYYLSQGILPPEPMRYNPQLITDFVGYNSGLVRSPDRFSRGDLGPSISIREIQRGGEVRKEHFCLAAPYGMGQNWVGDLTISARVTVERAEGGDGGGVQFRLTKGGVDFVCDIKLADGRATLSIPGCDRFAPAVAATWVRGPGRHDIMFCNVDEEMRLIVDGREIDFGGKGRYDALCGADGPLPRDRSPNRRDLAPAGIGARGAAVRLDHLKILRDMYYIASTDRSLDKQCDLVYAPFRGESPLTEESLCRILSTPERWGGFGKTNAVTFKLGKGEYLMLGDNSAKSKDSRIWTEDGIPHYVTRDLLIGEAVFVYWPHGLRIPGTSIALIPNFTRMRFID